MMIAAVAALVFVGIVVAIVGLWWAQAAGAHVTQRLSRRAMPDAPEHQLLRADATAGASLLERLARRSDLVGQLTTLTAQAGSKQSTTDLLLIMATCGIVGAALGWWRIGSYGGALLAGLLTGAIPVLHLVVKRNRRLKRFEERFADAVDMISRSIRAGNALSAAIQVVGDEMADPVGHEFRQVTEEIRLGVDPGEALARLQDRIPTEDVQFFCNAVRIQRGAGGNLAEILDRLSDVIRKRFELLSHARVLSSQQRYAAIFVGLSPMLFSLIFYFLSPGYFDPLIASPAAPTLLGSGLALEVVGFLIIWRLARIKV
jgi:tight adherence protein B